MKKIKTGIAGLDELTKGGVREGSSILVTGPPGTGKTILAIQFIYEGAKKGEPGLYIFCEESVEDIRDYAKELGMDITKYEKNGLITLVKQSLLPKKLMSISAPLSLIKSKKIKRMALDSLTLFAYAYFPEETSYRREILDFLMRMKETGTTLMTIAEKSVSNIDEICYQAEDYLFDSVFILTKIRKASSFEYCIFISKMRGQDHLIGIFPFKIGKGGITIFSKQLPFSLIEEDAIKSKLK